MFELPELTVIAAQMNDVLPGLTVAGGTLGNTPAQVRLVRPHARGVRCADRRPAGGPGTGAGAAGSSSRSNRATCCSSASAAGASCYHAPGEALPAKYHLELTFTTGSALSATTQMWGGDGAVRGGPRAERKYVKDMRPTPVDDEFTFEYFGELVDAARRAASAASRVC